MVHLALIVSVHAIEKTFHEPKIKSMTVPPCSAAASLGREDTIPLLIDLMKWPTCSAKHLHQLIKRMADLKGNPFGELHKEGKFHVDFWHFVEWAEKEGYDMNSPPHPPDLLFE